MVAGGLSALRRHNFHMLHMKGVVDTLAKIEIGPHEDGESGSFVERTMASLREKDAETDVEKVQELMDAWKSGGLGVAGPEATLSAFQLG